MMGQYLDQNMDQMALAPSLICNIVKVVNNLDSMDLMEIIMLFRHIFLVEQIVLVLLVVVHKDQINYQTMTIFLNLVVHHNLVVLCILYDNNNTTTNYYFYPNILQYINIFVGLFNRVVCSKLAVLIWFVIVVSSCYCHLCNQIRAQVLTKNFEPTKIIYTHSIYRLLSILMNGR